MRTFSLAPSFVRPFRALSVILLLSALLASPALATLEEAEAAHNNHRWQQAITLYEPLMSGLEGEALQRARLHLGQAYWRTGEFDAAAKQLAPVAADDSFPLRERVNAGRLLGRALADGGRPGEAAEALRNILKIPGISSQLFFDTALLAGDIQVFDAGDIPKGLALYEEALRVREITGSTVDWKRLEDAEGRVLYAKALMESPRHFWMGPYVTHLTPSGAQVRWVSGEDHPEGSVTLEIAGEERTFAAEAAPMRFEPTFKLQTARLQGLEGHTDYAYTARVEEETRDGEFRTLLPPGAPGKVRFLVYGDTQDRPQFHRPMADIMAKERADFVLHTGDCVGNGSYFPHWKAQFFDPGEELFSSFAIFPTVGNHDGFQFFDELFLDGTPPYHTFTSGNVQVFIIASYRSGGMGSAARDAQIEWLRQALQESKADWKIAVTHYPMISANPDSWNNWGQEDFIPLFEEYGMDVVFTGHEHIYRRFLPLGPAEGPVTFHITSGGGASVGGDFGREGGGEPYMPNPLTGDDYRALHYLVVEVDGDTMSVQAKLRDGTLLDEFELEKRDGQFVQAILDQAVPFAYANIAAKAYTSLQLEPVNRHSNQAPANFTAKDEEGAFAVELHTPLPEGSGRLHVRPADNGDTPWQIEETVIEAGQPVRFTARNPGATAAPRGVEVTLQLENNGRTFQPANFTILNRTQ